jgi:uncharacterized protein
MIKKIILWVVVFVFLLLSSGYGFLKYNGLIPRYIYETVAPELPRFQRPTVLVFNKTNGFIHRDGLPAADAMLRELAENQGWDVYITNNGAIHNLEDLKRFKLVVWNNTSGDVLTESQRSDFKTWLEQGGGWVGLHAAGGDLSYKWDWYVDTLIGAQFVGHTMNPQFQNADLYATNKTESMTSHLPTPWNVKQEEWYAFDQNPRNKGYEVLVAIDEESYITVGKGHFMSDSMEGEHPLVWRHMQGEGKVFYSSIGHTAETYALPEFRELIKKSMLWAAD